MATHADGFGLIQDIDVQLTVELGRKSMRLRDVLALGEIERCRTRPPDRRAARHVRQR
ncbi:FliM/FliN family flagellar motor switch protein [Qipengyuania sp. GPGPB31]|uniref:FliM/FliN family flagellar motor switch protein n=1 Tax=Qipengyuania sp. GPGPB31 TaxID=3023518 RepID=UPI00313428C3